MQWSHVRCAAWSLGARWSDRHATPHPSRRTLSGPCAWAPEAPLPCPDSATSLPPGPLSSMHSSIRTHCMACHPCNCPACCLPGCGELHGPTPPPPCSGGWATASATRLAGSQHRVTQQSKLKIKQSWGVHVHCPGLFPPPTCAGDTSFPRHQADRSSQGVQGQCIGRPAGAVPLARVRAPGGRRSCCPTRPQPCHLGMHAPHLLLRGRQCVYVTWVTMVAQNE